MVGVKKQKQNDEGQEEELGTRVVAKQVKKQSADGTVSKKRKESGDDRLNGKKERSLEPKQKKAKSDSQEASKGVEQPEIDSIAESSTPVKKKKLGKKEREKAKKRAAEGTSATPAAGPAPSKKRYTLFVGNLPYDITKDEIEEYFGRFTKNQVQSVRMLTDRGTGEFKGTCFLDLEDAHSYEVCLRLHHTKLQDRKINVEPTVGGGGNSETRRKKLKMKTQQITKQRRKRVAKAEVAPKAKK